MIRGIPSKPFSVHTLPPPSVEVDEKRIETIRRLSRERYAERASVVEEKIAKWIAGSKTAKASEKVAEKAKEKEEEELKKAKKRGMTLAAYRAWRDRELWTNEFNAFRKKVFVGETLMPEEQERMKDLEAKLEKSGGVPPPSKTLLAAKEAASK
jgi:hypothetical protein